MIVGKPESACPGCCLDEQDGVAERDRLLCDATRVKNELVAAYSVDDRAVAARLGARP